MLHPLNECMRAPSARACALVIAKRAGGDTSCFFGQRASEESCCGGLTSREHGARLIVLFS